MTHFSYQIGGSLPSEAPSYVKREADEQLYHALKQGEFCYVLNSRQMGKSSLLVRTKHRLQVDGFLCTGIDLTSLGSEIVTPLQWYKGIVAQIWSEFKLFRTFNLKAWWQQQEDVSLLARLSYFIRQVLLVQFPHQQFVIFIDEIDSILSLDFPVDDFFAFIRYCYNQRSLDSEYKRITFAIFGVATPSDLIADKTRTPFNIGKAIKLQGFRLQEAQPLLNGLQLKRGENRTVLKEILAYTGGQPFLTQKLCQLVVESSQTSVRGGIGILPGAEVFWVASIVKSRIIEKWESQDEPEHLKTIRDRILRNTQRAGRLLGIYQQILQGVEVASDDSLEQVDLLLSGLVVKHEGILKVKNRIYQDVFNLEWVETQLSALRPYSQTFDAWVTSKQQDESRLLRGQALKEAQIWAQGKSLSDLDYKFLAASQGFDRKQIQQTLELERVHASKRIAKIQRILLGVFGVGLVMISGLAVSAFWQYRNAVKNGKIAQTNEIKALVSSSQGRLASDQQLDALVDAIKAKRKLQQLEISDPQLAAEVEKSLRQAVYWTNEKNRFSGNESSLIGVDVSSDGQLIAGAITEGKVKIWKPDGTLVQTFENEATVFRVRFSPNRPLIASSNLDGTIKLWNLETGELEQSIAAHQGAAWNLEFSPDSKTIASAGADSLMKLWDLDGNLLATFRGHQEMIWAIAFSPDGQSLASASLDDTVKLWNRQGQLLNKFDRINDDVWSIAFSPDGKLIATGGDEQVVQLWQRDGTLVKTLEGHSNRIEDIAFSPDGETIASVSQDKTVRLWSIDGTLLKTFQGHNGIIRGVGISPANPQIIASSSEDKTIRLWQQDTPLLKTFSINQELFDIAFTPDSQTMIVSNGPIVYLRDRHGKISGTLKGDGSNLFGFAVSPDGKLIAVTSSNGIVKLWQPDGTLVRTLEGHQGQTWDAAFSPDGELIASTSEDGTVKLSKTDGTLLKTLEGHQGRVYRVVFSPDGDKFASASSDGKIKLWNRDGTPFKTLVAHDSDIFGLSASPDGQLFATSSMDQTVKLWRWDGTLVRTIKGHENGVPSVDFSPDGRLLATGSTDRTVKLWKIDGTEVKTLDSNGGGFWSVKFSPDGKTLVTASDDRKVMIWNLKEILALDELTYACNWVRDYLKTNAEVQESDIQLCNGIGTQQEK